MRLTIRMTNSKKSFFIYFMLIYLTYRFAFAYEAWIYKESWVPPETNTTEEADTDYPPEIENELLEIIQNDTIKEYEEILNLINEKFNDLKNELNQNVIIEKGTDFNPKIYDEHFYCQENCQVAYKNCEEAILSHDQRKGVYLIKIPDSELKPFYAYCFNDWMIIQRQSQTEYDPTHFYDWNEYKKGFGNIFGDHWLGLEKIHEITKNDDQELSILLEGYKYKEHTVCYSKFSIGNEKDGYKLSINDLYESIGNANAANPKPLSNGSKFSTYDNDNDLGNLSCERILQGAWWNNACSLSDEDGTLYAYLKKDAWYKLYWDNWSTYNESLQIVQMAIRPRTGKCFK